MRTSGDSADGAKIFSLLVCAEFAGEYHSCVIGRVVRPGEPGSEPSGLRLRKIGTIITRHTRSIRLWLSSSFPLKELFYSCLRHFADSP